MLRFKYVIDESGGVLFPDTAKFIDDILAVLRQITCDERAERQNGMDLTYTVLTRNMSSKD